MFLDSANSRETSLEIMQAIYSLAQGDEAEAVRIWEEPSQWELDEIRNRVTSGGSTPSEFYWGFAGPNWYRKE